MREVEQTKNMYIWFNRYKILGNVIYDPGKQISHYLRKARDGKIKGKGRITKEHRTNLGSDVYAIYPGCNDGLIGVHILHFF